MTPHSQEPGNGASKSHSPLAKAQKSSQRVITRAQAVSRPGTTSSTSDTYQNKRKRQRAKDDNSHDDMVQVKLESIHLQKGLKAIATATPANKRGTSTNNLSPQSSISFKKIKPGSPRKAAPGKKQVAFATMPVVCERCQEVGHNALSCE